MFIISGRQWHKEILLFFIFQNLLKVHRNSQLFRFQFILKRHVRRNHVSDHDVRLDGHVHDLRDSAQQQLRNVGVWRR